MEAFAALAGVVSIGNSILRNAADLYSDLDDWEDWKPIEGRYLAVFDLNTNPDSFPRVLMHTGEDRSTVLRDLRDLPRQQDHTIRVYVAHDVERNQDLKVHIEQLTSTRFSDFIHGQPLSTVAPLGRRLEGNNMPWWQESICTFGTGNGSQGLFQSLVRCHVRLRCIWRESRMLCFIVCSAEAANYTVVSRSRPIVPENPVFRELTRLSNNIMAVQQRIMMFRVCNAVLKGYSEFLSGTEYLYRIPMRRLNDPGRTTINDAILQVLSRDSYFWEQVQQDLTLFLTAIGFFQDSLQLMDDILNNTEYQESALNLRALVTALDKQISSMSTRLDSRLRFLEIRRTLHESKRVQLLSLLAVIFLPLSLASSILSMQTRFSDLHYLLYDFFGVIFLLGTLTFILLGILVLFQWSYGKFYNWLNNFILSSFISTKRAPINFVLPFCVPWMLIVASFLVGMLNDVGLGLKILGYGSGGVFVLFGGIVWLMKMTKA